MEQPCSTSYARPRYRGPGNRVHRASPGHRPPQDSFCPAAGVGPLRARARASRSGGRGACDSCTVHARRAVGRAARPRAGRLMADRPPHHRYRFQLVALTVSPGAHRSTGQTNPPSRRAYLGRRTFRFRTIPPGGGYSMALAIRAIPTDRHTAPAFAEMSRQVGRRSLRSGNVPPANSHIPQLDFPPIDANDIAFWPGHQQRASRTRVLVTFTSTATVDQANAALRGAGVTIFGGLPKPRILLVGAADSADFSSIDMAIEALRASPAVEAAAPSVELEVNIVPRRAEAALEAAPATWAWDETPTGPELGTRRPLASRPHGTSSSASASEAPASTRPSSTPDSCTESRTSRRSRRRTSARCSSESFRRTCLTTMELTLRASSAPTSTTRTRAIQNDRRVLAGPILLRTSSGSPGVFKRLPRRSTRRWRSSSCCLARVTSDLRHQLQRRPHDGSDDAKSDRGQRRHWQACGPHRGTGVAARGSHRRVGRKSQP